jgi:hypothetical protein
MKNNLQKIGGIAALIQALAYIIGFTALVFLLTPENADTLNNSEKLRFILDNKVLFQIWILIIYVVYGVALIALTLALHKRLAKYLIPTLQIATVLGYIWSGMVIASGMITNIGLDTVAKVYLNNIEQATTIWLTIEAVQNGIGGGVEIVGGLWVLLISWFALKSKEFPKMLNYIGLTVGATGVLTVIPGLSELGAVFGLLQIVWFAWIGIFLLRNQ